MDRSALVLKLLTCREHGSLVAAVTLGLPELAGGARNWDYRYTWLRDSAFAMYAFMWLGFIDEAREFTRWLRERLTDGLSQDSDDGPSQVVYSLDGTPVPDEVTLDHLAGCRESRPMRLENGALSDAQHHVVILSAQDDNSCESFSFETLTFSQGFCVGRSSTSLTNDCGAWVTSISTTLATSAG